jgi:hypothetical protein
MWKLAAVRGDGLAGAAVMAPTRSWSTGADAELVPAEPVGAAAVAGHGLLQRGGQPDQQRVAGRVAEGVVVGLEPVEVDRQQRLGRAGRPQPLLQVELAEGRSHSDAWVGATVWSTTASSSAERASRLTCSRSRAANTSTVPAAS